MGMMLPGNNAIGVRRFDMTRMSGYIGGRAHRVGAVFGGEGVLDQGVRREEEDTARHVVEAEQCSGQAASGAATLTRLREAV